MKIYKALIIFIAIFFLLAAGTGCREYDSKLDLGYFFKTGPEKAVLDFLQAIENEDPDYIYSNLLQNKDKNKISREKYVDEFQNILSDVKDITVNRTVYLGYEGDMSKVVAEFSVTYKNEEVKEYKKYIYLIEENNKWKIVFEKTFI